MYDKNCKIKSITNSLISQCFPDGPNSFIKYECQASNRLLSSDPYSTILETRWDNARCEGVPTSAHPIHPPYPAHCSLSPTPLDRPLKSASNLDATSPSFNPATERMTQLCASSPSRTGEPMGKLFANAKCQGMMYGETRVNANDPCAVSYTHLRAHET